MGLGEADGEAGAWRTGKAMSMTLWTKTEHGSHLGRQCLG